MYYEVHGSGGRPLLLLHGNLSTIGVDFGGIIPSLATQRQVIAVEQQAHGHTADIDRPLSIPTWTGDSVALLRHLGVGQADVLGYSSGSAVAMQLALDHPELVGKLVLASFSYRLDGLHPGLMDNISDLQPEHLAGTLFEQDYARVAPNPGDWPRLIEKIKVMDADLPEWTADQVRGITAPTMLIIGDSDIVQPEHTVEIFRLLGGGVPATSTACPERGWPCSPAPPTSPWSRGATGWPRWSGSSWTPGSAEPSPRHRMISLRPPDRGVPGHPPLHQPHDPLGAVLGDDGGDGDGRRVGPGRLRPARVPSTTCSRPPSRPPRPAF